MNGAEILTNRAVVAIILEVAHMMMVIAITEKGEKKMPFIDEDHHPKLKVVEAEILEVRTTTTVLGLNFDVDKIGKTVFLTKEEADKALAEREEK